MDQRYMLPGMEMSSLSNISDQLVFSAMMTSGRTTRSRMEPVPQSAEPAPFGKTANSHQNATTQLPNQPSEPKTNDNQETRHESPYDEPESHSILQVESSSTTSEQPQEGTTLSSSREGQRDPESKTTPREEQDSGIASLSVLDKIGIWGIVFLSLGYILPLGSLGFLGILWFANPSNNLWRRIASDNWMPRAIAICAEVIK